MTNTRASFKILPSRLISFTKKSVFEVEIQFYLIFLAIILVGFWPVSTGIFSLKNDEIIYFLPYRYNIVESIRSGCLPLWSPYIYMGFPISGDMQSGAWNPLVWLLSLTGRYTLTTLHAELLVYIFVGTVGMFKLLRTLRFGTMVCLTIAVSFTFSGFIVDSGQFICWVSSACFLPYTYIYFIRLLERPAKTTTAKFAASNFFLLIAAGYPFFFIANIYFFSIAFVLFFISAYRNQQVQKAARIFKYLTCSVLLFLLLSAAPLLCFYNLLPYYSRGTSMAPEAALFNSYSVFSSISLMFPFSITREHPGFGNNNVLSRNLYLGIILLPFIIKGIFSKRNMAWNTVLAFTVASFAVSLGQQLPFRSWAYRYLPLMNTFRHPSNFRLFVMIGLLLFAAKGLQQLLMISEKNKPIILRLFYVLLTGMIVTGLCFLPVKELSPFHHAAASIAGFKNILNKTSFNQAVLMSLMVQLPFLILAIIFLKKGRYSFICFLTITNVFVLAQPQLLSSTVAKNPVSEINTFIRRQPKGFPDPSQEPVSFPDENKFFLYEYKEPIKYFFNKKIAINTFINNPTILKSYNDFINDSNLVRIINNTPFTFLADSAKPVSNLVSSHNKAAYWPQTSAVSKMNADNRVSLLLFTPNEFIFSIKTRTPNLLVIVQNNFPGWVTQINNTLLPIETVDKTFMGLKIPAGSYLLKLRYKPGWLVPGLIVSFTGLLAIIGLLAGNTVTNIINRSKRNKIASTANFG